MKHRIMFIILFVIYVLFISSISFSYLRNEHDIYLKKVLFGNYEVSESNNAKLSIELLNNAVYLSVDYYSNNRDINAGEESLKVLKNAKIKNLPNRVQDIDYSAFGDKHRRFTHKGWETYNYSSTELKNGHWSIRRKIFQSTVNKIFNFKLSNDKLDGNNKCNAVSQLAYYVHIISDHIYDYNKNNFYSANTQIELGGRKDGNDILSELLKLLDILFESQKGKETYKALRNSLMTLNSELKIIQSQTGGLNTNERKREYQSYSLKIMNALKSYVPYLLREEEFFNLVFYK